jgi:hypothetical protein
VNCRSRLGPNIAINLRGFAGLVRGQEPLRLGKLLELFDTLGRVLITKHSKAKLFVTFYPIIKTVAPAVDGLGYLFNVAIVGLGV